MSGFNKQLREINELRRKTPILKYVNRASLNGLFLIIVYIVVAFIGVNSLVTLIKLLLDGSVIGYTNFFIFYYLVLTIISIIAFKKKESYKAIIVLLLLAQLF